MTAADRIRGGLVASIQLSRETQLGKPEGIASLAQAAANAGAAGLRIESAANVRAVRARVAVPVIGIVKRDYAGFDPYITPTLREVRELLEAGAEIVAFDATRRERPDATMTERIAEVIHDGGALAMADCALAVDGEQALAGGVDIVATTLCGYTVATRGASLPALHLVAALATFGAFTICEGGVSSPRQGVAAIAAGADAIVVGNAITAELDVATAENTVARRSHAFVAALARRREGSEAP